MWDRIVHTIYVSACYECHNSIIDARRWILSIKTFIILIIMHFTEWGKRCCDWWILMNNLWILMLPMVVFIFRSYQIYRNFTSLLFLTKGRTMLTLLLLFTCRMILHICMHQQTSIIISNRHDDDDDNDDDEEEEDDEQRYIYRPYNYLYYPIWTFN